MDMEDHEALAEMQKLVVIVPAETHWQKPSVVAADMRIEVGLHQNPQIDSLLPAHLNAHPEIS